MIFEKNIEFVETIRAMYREDLMMKPLFDDIEQVIIMCSQLDENKDLFQPTIERTDKDITLEWKYQNENDDDKHYSLRCSFKKNGMKKICDVQIDDGSQAEMEISYYVSELLIKTLEFYIKTYTSNLFN